METSKNIPRIITWLVVAVIGLVVIGFPLGYFLISYQYTLGRLEAEAEVNAGIIAQIISENPEMWEFRHTILREYLSRRPRHGYAESRRIFNAKNKLIAESADKFEPPVTSRSVELFDSGIVVGRLEITRSMRPLLIKTILITVIALTGGIGVFIVLRILPVQTLYRAEEELRKHRLHLEELVKERTAELTKAKEYVEMELMERIRAEGELQAFAERLQQSNKELEAFTSIASHDLQEPLRKVIAFGDRLKVKCGNTLDVQCRDYLERMQNAAGRMQTLISDLLTFSRITTKAQSFVPVHLNKVIQEVISDIEVRIDQTGGHVEVGDLPTVEADSLQMRQLFQNLIGNALKFHKKDEPPIVKVYARVFKGQRQSDPPLNELCQITVEDNGIGFDEKYLDRIFGMFQRLHSRNEYEGTGVGLAICRKIAERHGGSITAKSRVGQGATFVVTLPVKQQIGGEV